MSRGEGLGGGVEKSGLDRYICICSAKRVAPRGRDHYGLKLGMVFQGNHEGV